MGSAAHLRAGGRERVRVKLIELAAAHAIQPHARHCRHRHPLLGMTALAPQRNKE